MYIEIIDTLQLLFTIGNFLLLFLFIGNILNDEYKPKPMDEKVKAMYS